MFKILGEHDALKSDKRNFVKVIPLSSKTPTFDANRCRHIPLTWPPSGAGMVCFTILGEHDALKSDEPTSLKVIPLSSETPTFDANLCRHTTLTYLPLGS